MWAWVKKVLGTATGLCTPDQAHQATLTPLAETSSSNQSLITPLPLGYSSGQAGSISISATAQDVPDKTPEDAGGPSTGRYIVSAKGLPVGIANTVSKYRESQPVRTHMTPFEQRIAAKLTEEQQVAAAAAAAAAAVAGSIDDGSSDVSSVRPHQLHFLVSANSPE